MVSDRTGGETPVKRLDGCLFYRQLTGVNVGIAYLELAENGKAPSKVLLLHDGHLDWEDFPDVTLDAKSAEAVIAAFDKHGADIPIDYHHATTKTEDGRKAPAAGWVKSLSYEKGKGLMAEVEWSDTAKREIESQQYKYLSPVIFFDEDKKIVLELDSVALTNRPRTRNMPALLEAAERRMGRSRMESETMPKNKSKKSDMRRPLAWRKLAKAEEVVPGIDVDVEALPEEQVKELDEVGMAIATLADAIRGAGGELDEGADTVSILAMATDMVGGAPAPEEEDTSASTVTKRTVTEEMADALGLKKGAAMELALAEINKLTAKQGSADSQHDRLVKLEAELAERKASDKTRAINAFIEEHVESGRLILANESQMKAVRALAESNMDECRAFVETLPIIADPGKIDFTGSVPKNSRERIMAEAGKEWESEPVKRMGNSKKSWINNVLDEEREDVLTKAECDKIGVC